MSLFLLTLLTSCASRIETVPVPVPVKITPPEILMSEIPVPVFSGTTNGDLLDYILELRRLLGCANEQLKAIKEFCGKE